MLVLVSGQGEAMDPGVLTGEQGGAPDQGQDDEENTEAVDDPGEGVVVV